MQTCHKYSGAGNTFLIVDDRDEVFPIKQVASFCHSAATGPVDGMLLWRSSTRASATMVYFNRDGSQAQMCGNGLRCFVHFLRDQGLFAVDLIEVGGHFLQVGGTPPQVWTHLQPARPLLWNISLLDRPFYIVDTGVPHAVTFAQGPFDLVEEGRAIRRHPQFAPSGVNVNFALVHSRSEISIRTYERGVEGETLACGTGAAASAFVAKELGLAGDLVRVVTRSGEVLEIDLTEGNRVSGPSEYLGTWQLSG